MPTKPQRLFTRRQFLGSAALLLGGGAAESFVFEPYRLQVEHVKLTTHRPVCRFVVWSDFHYRGEVDYAEEIVATINRLEPDFVCFVGDLIDDPAFHRGALGFIRKIRRPVYGVPGNHDYATRVPFAENAQAFGATGGAWLVNKIARPLGGALELCGSAERYAGFIPVATDRPRVLLTHYPKGADETGGRVFTAIFSGHSHGGQVRLPFYGAVALPRYVGAYEKGLFQTPGGPLYVTAGVGTFGFPVRLNCPPELTVVEL